MRAPVSQVAFCMNVCLFKSKLAQTPSTLVRPLRSVCPLSTQSQRDATLQSQTIVAALCWPVTDA
jgi:hypothetical protein